MTQPDNDANTCAKQSHYMPGEESATLWPNGSGTTQVTADSLLEALLDADPKVSMYAALHFRTINAGELPSAILKKISDMLLSHRETDQIAAAVTISSLGAHVLDDSIYSSLLLLACTGPSPEARAAALGAVGCRFIMDSPVREELIVQGFLLLNDFLSDASPLVRLVAVRLITNFGSLAASPKVFEKLVWLTSSDCDTKVRHEASQAWEELTDLAYEASATPLADEVGQSSIRTTVQKRRFSSLLTSLKILVRVGPVIPTSLTEWKRMIDSTVESLAQLEKQGYKVSVAEKLKVANLRADFLDRCGDYVEASRLLREAAQFPLKGTIEGYVSIGDATRDPTAFKQKIWIYLEYVWCHHYRAGDYKRAKDLLEIILPIIQSAATADEPLLGTFSRWHYIYAHCARGFRMFFDAEKHFSEAAHFALQRARARSTRGEEDPAFEIRWSVILTARIQGPGLGWSFLKQGRLSEAHRALMHAQIPLESTGDRLLKVFNRSLMAIAERRRLFVSDGSHSLAMNQLRECANEYHEMAHHSGELRCLQELCRGYLDVAEFSTEDDARHEAKENARVALSQINERRKLDSDNRWAVRYDLLRARYEITPLCEAIWVCPISNDALLDLMATIDSHCGLRSGDGHLLVISGLLHWLGGNYEMARERFISVVQQAESADPVLELEAWLMRSWCISTEIVTRVQDLRAGREDFNIETSRYLEGLSYTCDSAFNVCAEPKIGQIENAYLKELANRVRPLVAKALSAVEAITVTSKPKRLLLTPA